MPISSTFRPWSRAAASWAGPASPISRASCSGCVHIASRIFDTAGTVPRSRVASAKLNRVNAAQTALLARLRELIVETPESGALNAGRRPLHITRFAQAVERRADDGSRLVDYIRSKLHEPATSSYSALIEAGRSDLTVEALVAAQDAPWASEFTDDDRSAARERLGTMLEADQARRDAAEEEAVAHDRKIVGMTNERR